MTEFPILKTQRLRLGKLRVEDIKRIVELANNKTISDNTLTFPYPYTEENAIFWINFSNEGFKSKEHYVFGIFLNEETFIGGIGLHLDNKNSKAELGYWIAEPYWKNGFATEASERIIKFGFEYLNLNKIYATHFIYNPDSEKVLIKIGMQYEGLLKCHHLKNGKFEDVKQYAILKSEFQKK